MQNTSKLFGKIGAKKLVLSRETLRTLAPADLVDVRGGLTSLCIIVTQPETYDGPECRPHAAF